jgi:hypothetical protein
MTTRGSGRLGAVGDVSHAVVASATIHEIAHGRCMSTRDLHIACRYEANNAGDFHFGRRDQSPYPEFPFWGSGTTTLYTYHPPARPDFSANPVGGELAGCRKDA